MEIEPRILLLEERDLGSRGCVNHDESGSEAHRPGGFRKEFSKITGLTSGEHTELGVVNFDLFADAALALTIVARVIVDVVESRKEVKVMGGNKDTEFSYSKKKGIVFDQLASYLDFMGGLSQSVNESCPRHIFGTDVKLSGIVPEISHRINRDGLANTWRRDQKNEYVGVEQASGCLAPAPPFH